MRRLFFSIFLGITVFFSFAIAQTAETGKPVKTKLYTQMGFDEKIRFVEAKSAEILELFNRTEGDEINEIGLRDIQRHLDAYAKRLSKPKSDTCDKGFGNDLTSLLKRGNKYASDINAEFSSQKLPVQLGLYTAMIESEFCPCMQSPTGALGMFQFTSQVAKQYGINAVSGATVSNPDDRCQPKPAAGAAAKYYKMLINDIFGNDAVGIPVSIGAYNRGEGMTKKHISEVIKFSKAKRISFWVLIDTQELLAEKLSQNLDDENSELPGYFQQFQMENYKYVPKFFAAAIIGENPRIFGIEMEPLSQIK